MTAISSGVTMILHVVSTDGERRLTDGQAWDIVDGGGGVSYGPGFMLVGAAMGCFIAAAVSLCLDDTVRAVTRALYHCQRRRAPATGQANANHLLSLARHQNTLLFILVPANGYLCAAVPLGNNSLTRTLLFIAPHEY